MEKEEQIIGMLEQVMDKLDEHTKILGDHGEKLDEHTKILGDHGEKLELHSSQLSEHGQILSALLTGQDHLKAEIDGMKISNAKEFGAIKEEISKVSSNQEHLSKFTWKNMEDIHHIKNKMGMR